MILRGVIIADKLFGGEFVVEDSGEKSFKAKMKYGTIDYFLKGSKKMIYLINKTLA